MRTRSNSERALALLLSTRPYRVRALVWNGPIDKLFTTEKEAMEYAAALNRPAYLNVYHAENIDTWNQNGRWRRLLYEELHKWRPNVKNRI